MLSNYSTTELYLSQHWPRSCCLASTITDGPFPPLQLWKLGPGVTLAIVMLWHFRG